jgi:hypothetical protein
VCGIRHLFAPGDGLVIRTGGSFSHLFGAMGRLNSPVVLYPMLALLVLAGGALIYFLPWVSSREASLDDTALRALAAVGDQLSRRMASMAQVLGALRRTDSPPKDYLRAQASSFQSDGSCQKPADAALVSLLVVERTDGRRFQLSTKKNCLSATVESVLGPLVPPQGIFEDIVLADARGVALYQTALTGLRISDISALLELTPGTTAPKAPAPARAQSWGVASVQQVRIGETDYRLYSMPLLLAGLADSEGGRSTLILAGLIKKNQFQSLALAQSGTVFIWVVLLVLLVLFASWPLLKFTRMGRTERVKRWSGLMLLASILASTGLATLLILHGSYLSDPREREQTAARLQSIAKQINENVASELRAALRALAAAEEAKVFGAAPLEHQNGADPDLRPSARPSVLNEFPVFFGTYPYFEDMFWADAYGNQRVKWTTHSIVTPQTNLASYPFFRETIHGNLWAFERSCKEEAPCEWARSRFRVDPLYSPNSGEYVAVVSRRFDPPRGSHAELATASISTRLATLIEPLLPPEYGFAIIDHEGTILFHSMPGPNIERNFFLDCKDPEVVRGAANSRTVHNLRMEYQGESDDFYITPVSALQDCPWTLIVFRGTSGLAAKHIERMLLFFVLVLIYGTAASLVGVAVSLLLPHYPPRWLWPEAARKGEYLQLALCLALIYLAAISLDFEGDWRVAVMASFGTGLGGFGVVWFRLQGLDRPLGAISFLLGIAAVWFASVPLAAMAISTYALRSRRIRGFLKRLTVHGFEPSDWYTLGGVALVFVSGVLPCIGFFKVADDFENAKFLMRDELLTLGALELRAHHLREHYSSILADKGEVQAPWDISKSLFLRARLASQWDRFDGMTDSVWTYAEPDVLEGAAWAMIQKFASITARVPNHGAELARGTALGGCAEPNQSVCWSLEGADRLRITRPHGKDSNELADLISEETGDVPGSLVTNYSKLRGLNRYATSGLVLLGIGLFVWLRLSLRRLFLLDTRVPPPWPALDWNEVLQGGRHILVIGLPGTGKSAFLTQRADANTIDMAEPAAAESVNRSGLGKATVLDNFDAVLDSPNDPRAIRMVENLARETSAVVLVSNSDPWFRVKQWLAEASNDSDRLRAASRWQAALANFTKVSLRDSASAWNTPFEVLWAACTVAERVALYQLAHDGWANHKNGAALVNLCRRGLVKSDPVFQIFDESLRVAILNQVDHEQARTWSRDEGPSAWDGLRIVFGIAGFAILVLLFFWAQQRGLALVTAGLSAAGSAMKMVADFRGRNAAAAKGTAA